MKETPDVACMPFVVMMDMMGLGICFTEINPVMVSNTALFNSIAYGAGVANISWLRPPRSVFQFKMGTIHKSHQDILID
jgi:hypothetical protein